MANKNVLSALAGLILGTAVLAGGSTAAQAEGVSLGFDFGNGQFSIGIDDGRRGFETVDHRRRDRDRHWDRDRHADRWWREHRGDRWDRRDRHRKVVQVCEPVWRVKKIYDDWGNLRKTIRVRDEECRWIRR